MNKKIHNIMILFFILSILSIIGLYYISNMVIDKKSDRIKILSFYDMVYVRGGHGAPGEHCESSWSCSPSNCQLDPLSKKYHRNYHELYYGSICYYTTGSGCSEISSTHICTHYWYCPTVMCQNCPTIINQYGYSCNN